MTEQTQTDVQPIYSQSDRKVQNAVATAILVGQVVERGPDPLWSNYSSPDAPQPAADELSQRLSDAGRAMYRAGQQTCYALEAGKDTAGALVRWQVARTDYERFARAYQMRQRQRSEVMRGGSATYYVDVAGRQYFTLDLWQTTTSEGKRYKVLNSEQLEDRAPFEAGEGAWADLVRWLLECEAGGLGSGGGGRPFDLERPVWRPSEGGLKLRSHVHLRFPLLTRALHCIGLTLRAKVQEGLTPRQLFEQQARAVADWAEEQEEERV